VSFETAVTSLQAAAATFQAALFELIGAIRAERQGNDYWLYGAALPGASPPITTPQIQAELPATEAPADCVMVFAPGPGGIMRARWGVYTEPAHEVTITIASGTAADGSLLANGAADPLVKLTDPAGAALPASTIVQPYAFFIGWTPAQSDVIEPQWIGPTNPSNGVYHYQIPLDLARFTGPLQITGSATADDRATLTLKGAQAATVPVTIPGVRAGLTPFRFDIAPAPGQILDFAVENDGGKTGLRYEFTITGPRTSAP